MSASKFPLLDRRGRRERLSLIASGGVVDTLMPRFLIASVLDLPPRLRQQGRRPFSLWRSHPSCPGRAVQIRDMVGTRGFPSFAKEGWLRHQENGPVPLTAQTGWLFQATDYPIPFGIISGSLKQPPRPLHKGCFAAFFFRSRPPLLREGGESPLP